MKINGKKLQEIVKSSWYEQRELVEKANIHLQTLRKSFYNDKLSEKSLQKLIDELNKPKTKHWFVISRVKRLKVEDFML